MLRLGLIAAFVLVACKAREPAPPQSKSQPVAAKPDALVARGTLERANVETGYGVALAAGSDPAALEQLARKKGGARFEVTRTTVTELLGPDYFAFLADRMAPADVAGLKASPAVIVIRGSGTDPIKLVRELGAVVQEVATAGRGWVVDPVTGQVHTAAEFREHIPTAHPDVRKLIVVHTIMGNNEQPFLDTAGMRRYGFPELYFAEAGTSHVDQIAHLINGVAQTLLDGGDVDERGEITVDFNKLGWKLDIIGAGTGKAVLKARWAKARDGHAEDELVVELVPPAGPGPEGAVALIESCFGAGPDHVTMLDSDDPELRAAAARARADLAKLRPRFAKGVPFGEQLTVKAKFTDAEEQVEWMWVDVVAFRGNVLEGTLANSPQLITTLRNGQKVKVKLEDVGDYLHGTPDGEPAGGYSIELMRKRGLLPADE